MKDTIVKIAGKEVDIAHAVPLVIRDWKVLAKKGITIKAFADGNAEAMAGIVHYVLNRADKSITIDDIDSLSLNSAAFTKVMAALGEEEEVDVPLSEPSTTLPMPMDGASQT